MDDKLKKIRAKINKMKTLGVALATAAVTSCAPSSPHEEKQDFDNHPDNTEVTTNSQNTVVEINVDRKEYEAYTKSQRMLSEQEIEMVRRNESFKGPHGATLKKFPTTGEMLSSKHPQACNYKIEEIPSKKENNPLSQRKKETNEPLLPDEVWQSMQKDSNLVTRDGQTFLKTKAQIVDLSSGEKQVVTFEVPVTIEQEKDNMRSLSFVQGEEQKKKETHSGKKIGNALTPEAIRIRSEISSRKDRKG